ncbi:MAG: NAD-dependent epimerase/dehydratase family protein [Gammaproteobacteria bacterium]|nr:NAD-dependent epimerase/dehydratase family protein [Gammaproteobacteria bacterium]
MTRILVTGAGGFIGHHLVTSLKQRGHWVRGVDIKFPEFTKSDADEFALLDLRRRDNCLRATSGIEAVYALAADMGGMGYLSSRHAQVLRNNALINLHTLDAARANGVGRYLFSSSACVYPEHLQTGTDAAPLKESDAYPAAPQDAYGWEKLITERALEYFRDEYGIETRIVRFHNIYGPLGTWEGGREKVPAALCRKVAMARHGDSIEIWGDGLQTRSFCYIDDCVEGIQRVMRSGHSGPLNLGSDQMITINVLATLVIGISGKRDISLDHVDGPQGVRGRNSDNALLRDVLGWAPSTRIEDGLVPTYRWIEERVRKTGKDG